MSAYNGLYPVNNDIYAGDVYPSMGIAQTAGDVATGSGDATTPTPTTNAVASEVSSSAKPLNWWIAMAVLFALLIISARYLHAGDNFESNFKQIRPSVYNIALITLVVIIGLPASKVLATYIPSQSLKSFILAV